jgi:hypothetical protein
VLAERNRFVWLGEKADDRISMTERLWPSIETAVPVSGSDVSSETVNSVMMTGSLAGLYFRGGLKTLPDEPVGVLVIISSGDAEEVRPGDILHMQEKATYRVVGRLSQASLAEVREAVFHRMGLQ